MLERKEEHTMAMATYYNIQSNIFLWLGLQYRSIFGLIANENATFFAFYLCPSLNKLECRIEMALLLEYKAS